jgi:hypothetical protein
MALRSTQTLNRNEYQKYFLGVKAAGALGWQPCHLHVPTVSKSGSLTSWNPQGLSGSVKGLLYSYDVTHFSKHAFTGYPTTENVKGWSTYRRYGCATWQYKTQLFTVHLPDATIPMNIAILRPTRRLGKLSRRVGQNRFALTSYGGKGLRERRRLSIPPHLPALKTHTFLVSQHLHSTWVADAASFHGSWVSSRLRLPGCMSNF